MKTLTGNWVKCNIKVERIQEDGIEKKVNEQYVVLAETFFDAQAVLVDEITDFEVRSQSFANFSEVIFTDEGDTWYQAKVAFITLDEKSGKEKRKSVPYLVQAASISSAVKHITNMFNTTVIDYKILSVAETKIIDVYEHYQQKISED